MTYREYVLKAEGYSRVQNIENQRLRMLSYCVVKPYLKEQNLDIYSFMPLPDDPTIEEREQMAKEAEEKGWEEARIMKDRIMSKYNQLHGRI